MTWWWPFNIGAETGRWPKKNGKSFAWDCILKTYYINANGMNQLKIIYLKFILNNTVLPTRSPSTHFLLLSAISQSCHNQRLIWGKVQIGKRLVMWLPHPASVTATLKCKYHPQPARCILAPYNTKQKQHTGISIWLLMPYNSELRLLIGYSGLQTSAFSIHGNFTDARRNGEGDDAI